MTSFAVDSKAAFVMVLAAPVFLVDLLLSFLSLGWLSSALRRPKQYSSVRDKSASSPTHSEPRSSLQPGEPLVESVYPNHAQTIYEIVQGSMDRFRDHVAMRHRKFVELKRLKPADRFPSKVFDDSELVDITYGQLGEKIRDFGSGLKELGITSQEAGVDYNKVKGSLVIFEDTCAEWTMACQGAFSQSMVVATCYATLGDTAVVNAVKETQAQVLVCNWKNAEKFSGFAEDMPSLTTIVASTHEMPDGNKCPVSKNPDVKIVLFDDVLSIGKKNAIDPTPPKPSDVAVIMYTSGSTGKPKGVVMLHSQLVAGISGMLLNVTLREAKEIYVSYLPLAHILALQIENVLLSWGATICYTDPRELAHAMPMFSPTIFAGVPKVWSMLQAGLEKKISKSVPMKAVFTALIKWKMLILKTTPLNTPVSNLFFNLISKKVFGGILQFGISGGGPLGSNLHYFCRACFNCPIIQGYALTETCVGGCFQHLLDTRTGVLGPPVPCTEVVLQSEPDIKDHAGLPYLHTDVRGNNGEKILGRGEICIRGPCISSGYYQMPEKTKEDYDDEGYFHTGDIGQFLDDGVLQIIDRKKNLVKLKGGEYVAVESMETAFGCSTFVSSVCVIANGDLDGPLALAHGDVEVMKNWASENNIDYKDIKDLAEKKEMRQAVVKSMIDEGKKEGLTWLELRLKDCHIVVEDDWVPGHGMTASMKIDRKGLCKIYSKEIKQLYKRNGVVISS